MAPDESPAARLRAALGETGISARRLSRLLAERGGKQPESYRRGISKWLAGEGIGDESAHVLADIFGKPADYFVQPRVTSAQFAEAVGRLDRTLEDVLKRLAALERRRPSR